jgi:nicotinate-nucleotide--dimethylbenzimidazole phosphoribosyltransferase
VADLPPGAEIRHPHHDEAPTATANGSVDGGDAFSTPTMALPLVTTGARIQPGMDLPLPDETAGAGAQDRLAALDVAGAGFGALRPVVEFLAEAQGTPTPRAWSQVHVIALHGRHEGGASAGADPADVDRQLTRLRAGDGPLAVLAATAGAQVQVVDTAHSAAMEAGEVLSGEAVDAAVRQGWDLADAAVSGGADALVIAAYGTGGTAAAAAVVAATTGAEPVAVLGRVLTPGGYVDDHAWMVRCAAVRDALHRIRRSPRGPRDILAQLGGADIAVATGVVLGAAARRVPVLLDGPVGAAAGLVSRDYAAQARHWCLLVDDGGQPAVRQAADVLGLEPFLGLRLDLGEGANALAALPLLRAAVDLAARLGPHPALADGGYAEPASAGPGPTAVSA